MGGHTKETTPLLSPAARWEMVEAAQAKEVARLTNRDVLRIIRNLGNVDSPWRAAPNTSGLVEQQLVFQRLRKVGNSPVQRDRRSA